MKTKYRNPVLLFLLLLLFFLGSGSGVAQPFDSDFREGGEQDVYLSQRTTLPVCHYPLESNEESVVVNEFQGKRQGPMKLLGVSFVSNNNRCMYSAGEYDDNSASTPELSLDVECFEISADFYLDEIVKRRPVFVLGRSSRDLGFIIEEDGTVSLLWSNQNYVRSNVRVTLNEWHTAKIVFDVRRDNWAELYLDDRLACSLTERIQVNQNDLNVSITNYSCGETFQGWIKNLKVFTTII